MTWNKQRTGARNNVFLGQPNGGSYESQKNLLLIAIISLSITTIACGASKGTYVKRDDDRPRVLSAAFSPTGDILAVNFKSVHGRGIFLVDKSGKVFDWVCQSSKNKYCGKPIFSPDGRKIVMGTKRDGEYGDIYLLDITSKQIKRLTFSEYDDLNPIFSHDGKGIFFSRQKNPNCGPAMDSPPCKEDVDIYYTNPVNGKEQQITNANFIHFYRYSVFPNDKLFIVSSLDTFPLGSYLCLYGVNGSKCKEPVLPDLTPYAKNPREFAPVFNKEFIKIKYFKLSRDGRYMAFRWVDPKKKYTDDYQIYVTDMANMSTKKVTSGNIFKSVLDISADGSKILIKTHDRMRDIYAVKFPYTNLWMVNRDGSGMRNIPLDFSAVFKHKQPEKAKPTKP